MAYQSVQPEPLAARFLKSSLIGRGPVNRDVLILQCSMNLRSQARIVLGAFSAFGNPTLGSLKVARPRMSERGL
jgi:hypothetical protein